MEIFITQPSEINNVVIKPVFSADSLRIPISQHPDNVNVVTASYWPYESGWYFAEYANQQKWFYVYGNGWEYDASIKNYTFSKHQISKLNTVKTETSESSRHKTPDWIWLIGFLMVQFFLWAEQKF